MDSLPPSLISWILGGFGALTRVLMQVAGIKFHLSQLKGPGQI